MTQQLFQGQPLWGSHEPNEWRSRVIEPWQSQMRDLAEQTKRPELYGIVERHLQLLDGRGFDFDAAERRINEWMGRQSEEELGHGKSATKVKLKDVVTQSDVGQTKPTDPTDPEPEPPPTGAPTAIHDEATSEDLLGRAHLAESLAAMFAAEQQATPFTLALLGDWGSGKSSVMEIAMTRLREWRALPDYRRHSRFDFHYAKFNAWEYERTDNIRAGLAQEVISGLVGSLPWWRKFILKFRFGWREHPGPIVRAAALLTVVVLGGMWGLWFTQTQEFAERLEWVESLINTGIFAGVCTAAFFLWRHLKPILDHPLAIELTTYLKLPDYGEHLGVVPVMKRHIETLSDLRGVRGEPRNPAAFEANANAKWPWRLQCVNWLLEHSSFANHLLPRAAARLLFVKLAPRSTHRLIVFVDDLDRCEPKCINETLDAVRLVMDIPNVIVVIAIDHRIAMRAVAWHYRDVADENRDAFAIARDYLGKIIQLSVMLEDPSNLGGFIRGRLFTQLDQQQQEQIVAAWAERRDELERSRRTMHDDGKLTEGADEGEQANAVTSDGKAASPAAQQSEVKPNDLTSTPEPIAATKSAGGANLGGEVGIKPTQGAAAKTPEKPEVSVTLDERLAIMAEHVDDSVLFHELTHIFDFRNPRQLIRMRNTHRLLRQLTAETASRPDVDMPTSRQIMVMLFWIEYLNGLAADERAEMKLALFGAGDGTTVDRRLRIVHKTFAMADESGRAAYESIYQQVDRFVLPCRPEGRSPRPSDEVATAETANSPR